MRKLLLFAAAAGVFVAISTAYAVDTTIPYGDYQLRWILPAGSDGVSDYGGHGFDDQSSFSAMSGSELIVIRPTSHWKVKGVVSAKAMITGDGPSSDGIIGIMDESKGTGTGYDTAYLIPPAALADKTIDVSKFRKISIGPSPYAQEKGPDWKSKLMMLDEPDDVLIDVPLGGKDSGVIKQVGVESVRVLLGDNGYPGVRMYATFRGMWKTEISSKDGASYTLVTVDGNWNGVFTDKPSSGHAFIGDGDSLYVSASLPNDTGYGTSIVAGRPGAFLGKVYMITINKLGDSVSIKPYAGDTGKVQIKAVDGFGKPVSCDSIDLSGTNGFECTSQGETAELPVGSYSCTARLQQSGARNWGSGLSVDTDKNVSVKKDKVTVIALGGPLSAVVAPDDKQVMVAKGVNEPVKVAYRLGSPGGGVNGGLDQFVTSISIKDSRGKIIWKGKPGRDANYSLRVVLPGTLKLGSYTMVATVTNPAYQKPTITTKPLRVVKTIPSKPMAGLKPGTYKLEWKTVSSSYPPYISSVEVKLMSPDEVARVTGITLNKPYWGKDGKITVVVDKSAPDAQIHDTAYVIWDAPVDGKIDLSHATKCTLEESGSYAYEGEEHPSLQNTGEGLNLPVVLGAEGAQVRRIAEIGVQVELYPDESGAEVPCSASVNVYSAPRGKLTGGPGTVSIRLVDGNQNGLFNEEYKVKYGEHDWDSVIWDEPADDYYHAFRPMPLGKTVMYKGKHYELKVDSAGRSVDIKPYTGPMGTIKLDVVNAAGKPVKFCSLDLYTDGSTYVFDPGSKSFVVPTGAYRYRVHWLGDGSAKQWDSEHEVYIWVTPETSQQLKVTMNQVTALKLGGPIKLELEPANDVIVAKPGEQKKIDFSIKMGKYICGATGMPAVEIVDGSGNTVVNDELGVEWSEPKAGEMPVGTYTVDVPADLPVGDYTMTISVNTGSYQGVLSVKKTLRIAK